MRQRLVDVYIGESANYLCHMANEWEATKIGTARDRNCYGLFSRNTTPTRAC